MVTANLVLRFAAAAPWTLFPARSTTTFPLPSSNIRPLLIHPGGAQFGVTAQNSILRTMSSVNYHCVHVFIKVKPGREEAFKEASLKNARSSAQEEGVARFDVLQDKDDSTQFILVEVYKDADQAPVAHKATAHYNEWRKTVADMMAEPRSARKFDNLFPTTAEGWDYAASAKLE